MDGGPGGHFDDTLPEVFSPCSSLYCALLINQQTRGMSTFCRRSAVSRFARLQHALATFVVANPNRFVNARKENLPVADLARTCRSGDCLHDFLHHFIGQHDLDFRLRDQVHRVLASPIKLGVSFLPAMSSGFKKDTPSFIGDASTR